MCPHHRTRLRIKPILTKKTQHPTPLYYRRISKRPSNICRNYTLTKRYVTVATALVIFSPGNIVTPFLSSPGIKSEGESRGYNTIEWSAIKILIYGPRCCSCCCFLRVRYTGPRSSSFFLIKIRLVRARRSIERIPYARAGDSRPRAGFRYSRRGGRGKRVNKNIRRYIYHITKGG